MTYPDNGAFSTSLAGLAALLHAGFPVRAAAIQAPGEFDTHADEAGALTQGLQQTSQALAAFQHDLEQRNLGQRVVTLVWSEFGRRAAQNDTGGTDHGAAGVAFLMGERVKHRMVGEFPGLGRQGLDANGNVRETVDFRSVYKSLAEQWFGIDGNSVVPDETTLPTFSLVRLTTENGFRDGAHVRARRRTLQHARALPLMSDRVGAGDVCRLESRRRTPRGQPVGATRAASDQS